MDIETRTALTTIREGRSGLDHEKYATRYIAMLAGNVADVAGMVCIHLAYSNREAARHDLTHIRQRIDALMEAIADENPRNPDKPAPIQSVSLADVCADPVRDMAR